MVTHARATIAILVTAPVAIALLADCGPSSDCRELLQCPRQTADGGGPSAGGAGGSGGDQGGDGGQGGELPEDLGTPCTSPSECSTNQCVDGVCCISACDAPCESCAIDDALGLCTPHLPATDPETECGTGTCDGASQCAVGDHIWSAQYGDAMYQAVEGGDVDDAGNLYIAGSYEGSLDFGDGNLPSRRFYIAKFNDQGAHQWSDGFATGPNAFVSGLDVNSGGTVAIAGATSDPIDFGGGALPAPGTGNIFVAVFNPDGTHRWSKIFADGSPFDVAVDASGNTYLAGFMPNGGNVGGGLILQSSWFIAKYDTTGAHQWSQALSVGSGGPGRARLALAPNGDVVAAGDFLDSVNFGGGIRDSAGQEDMFVTRFDSVGNHLWDLHFGDGNTQNFQAVTTTSEGGVVLAGNFLGTVDFGGGAIVGAGLGFPFIVKLAANGNYLWSKTFGETSAFEANYQLAADASDNIILGGKVFGTINVGGGPFTDLDNGGDIIVAKFASNGDYLWHHGFQGTGAQNVNALGTSLTGAIAITGAFQNGPVDLGGGPLQTTGGSDYDILVGMFAP